MCGGCEDSQSPLDEIAFLAASLIEGTESLQVGGSDMASTISGTVLQAAAIPVKMGHVCLVSSRSGKRWVIPKGCLEPGKTSGEIALQEAWEEAGVVGVLLPDPVGSYLYDKSGVTCHVLVYLLQVTQVCDDWPEKEFRERCWVPPAQAVARIEDRGLSDILRGVLINKAG